MNRMSLGFVLIAFGQACGGESASTAQDKVSRICQQLAALPCAEAGVQQDCVSELEQERSDAIDSGCSNEYEDFLSCLAEGPMVCRTNGAKPFPAACEASSQQYDACENAAHPVCSVIPGMPSDQSPCATDCGVASATCTDSSPLTCSCITGKHPGATFTIETCDSIVAGVTRTCL